MPLKPIPDEALAEAQKELRHRLGVDEERPRPAVKNRPALVYLTDPLRVPFRGRLYELPPVGFRDGERIMEIQERLEDTDHSARKGRRALFEEAAALIRRLVTPDRGWLLRLRWRLRLVRNPFRQATEVEIAELLGFLAACRTRSTVRPRSGWDPLPIST